MAVLAFFLIMSAASCGTDEGGSTGDTGALSSGDAAEQGQAGSSSGDQADSNQAEFDRTTGDDQVDADPTEAEGTSADDAGETDDDAASPETTPGDDEDDSTSGADDDPEVEADDDPTAETDPTGIEPEDLIGEVVTIEESMLIVVADSGGSNQPTDLVDRGGWLVDDLSSSDPLWVLVVGDADRPTLVLLVTSAADQQWLVHDSVTLPEVSPGMALLSGEDCWDGIGDGPDAWVVLVEVAPDAITAMSAWGVDHPARTFTDEDPDGLECVSETAAGAEPPAA